MASTRGRSNVIPLTNKSGGQVIAGDVVIVDTANNEAFTTTTSAGYTGGVGVAQETIASNATGRVLISGYAALVNVNASVTRGNYGTTHTVAKQATSAGAARTVGTFCQFLTGGTTPTARVYPPDLNASSGAVATDAIWDAAGDLAVGTGADTAAKLTLGATGKVPASNGTTLAYVYPPGYEFDYATVTSGVSVTATSEATANTLVTANAVTYDGSTRICLEFFAPFAALPATSGANVICYLYDGSSSIGLIWQATSNAAATLRMGQAYAKVFITPSAAAKTYSIRASTSTGTATIGGGAAGSGAYYQMFIRQTKA